ncbi:hypothetical protein PRIPAC_96675 [Pristionchus pacificus]|uniref:Uncharacterized protein n=1 Tax=Pristionchus pacificus TaxID=54126 RepID=A0A2A6BK35_PRIPA|nr:hypothetical protein PRIPAC_96675 [Pristionchus pacificus]|eukprot:PDM66151.1 hypothetical protein PRIPAC_45376 [Pristionchus pacificus]
MRVDNEDDNNIEEDVHQEIVEMGRSRKMEKEAEQEKYVEEHCFAVPALLPSRIVKLKVRPVVHFYLALSLGNSSDLRSVERGGRNRAVDEDDDDVIVESATPPADKSDKDEEPQHSAKKARTCGTGLRIFH